MRLTFWGAAGEVTGSMHLVEAAGAKILLDAGLFQGRREGFRAEVIFGSDRERLKFVRDGGTLHISRRPDGALVKFTPPIKFPVDELRFEADCVRRVAKIVGAMLPLSESIKAGTSADTKAGIKWRPQTSAERVAAAKHAASVNVSSRGHWPFSDGNHTHDLQVHQAPNGDCFWVRNIIPPTSGPPPLGLKQAVRFR